MSAAGPRARRAAHRPALLGALVLGSLHILLVTIPVLIDGATGESQAWLTYFADLPLVAAMMAMGYLYDKTSYLILVCVLGPLMYAAVGALAGAAVGRIVRARYPCGL